jgi:hypothetical protein
MAAYRGRVEDDSVVIMFGRLLSLLGSAAVCAFAAASELQFEWASPLPHRQSWTDLAAGNGKVVGITDGLGGRHIYASADGKAWSYVNAPTNVTLRAVTFTGGKFLAVGDRSTILVSGDGTDWRVRQTDSGGGSLFAIDSGNGATVAVGYNATAFVSTDLLNWARIPGLGSAYSFLNVKFGNGRFVAVGQFGKLWSSVDGFTWQPTTWPQGLIPTDGSTIAAGLAFNNGVFLLGVTGGTAASSDGLNWSVVSPSGFSKLATIPNAVLGLGGTTISLTPTGSIWQSLLSIQAPAGVHLTCAAQLNGLTIAGGDNGLLYTSSDNSNWLRSVKEVDYSNSFLAFGNGLFVRFGSLPCVQISTDGADWQKISGAPSLRALTFGDGLWVGIDSSGAAAISSNAKTWETIPLPAPGGNQIFFANGRFVAQSGSGVLTSADGRNWQFIQIPGAQSITLIGYANGRWAAALDGSRPATSDDGVNWTVHPAQAALHGTVFAAGSDRFLAVGGGGMGYGFASWSADGITWQQQPLTSGTTFAAQSLTFGNGQFLLTDSYGGVFQSSDGLNWNGSRQAPQIFTAAAYGNGNWLIAGGDSILKSSTLLQSKSVVRLELTPQNFNTWALSIKGPPGESFSIEATADFHAAWAPVQSVIVPATGEILLPIDLSSGLRFFRAVSQN